jgi:hypothetical protein
MAFNYVDFYVIYKGNPYYEVDKVLEDDLVKIIVQKYYTILLTNKGEVLGEPNLGANLEQLLFETTLDEENVKKIIVEQLDQYIPEIFNTSFGLEVVFVEDPYNYQEIMFINLTLNDLDVVTQVGGLTR